MRRAWTARFLWTSTAMLLAVTTATTATAGANVGFLVAETTLQEPGPEAAAARSLAETAHDAVLVQVTGGGRFVDAQGEPLALERFDVIWLHEGDSVVLPEAIRDAKTIEALREYVADGRGLFLSGSALPLVHVLGIEPAQPRVGPAGDDRARAMLRPLVKQHPAFKGLEFAGDTAMISSSGHPAFSDFHGTGGPAGGMLLAQTGGSENALVEYELSKGRVVVMGWRLPHYGNRQNDHRENLERLNANILAYLADRSAWQKVVVAPVQLTRRPAAEPSPRGTGTSSEIESLRLAIEDLRATFPNRYPQAAEYLERLDTIGDLEGSERAEKFNQLKAEALLANPLLDLDRLLLIRRSANNLALPTNWQSNSSISRSGHDNQIMLLSPVRPDGKLTTVFQPEDGRFVGDVDLNFDGRRLLFSMPGANGRYQIHELNVDGTGLREMKLIDQPDVDNYDACYLPDGRVVFTSTAPFVGVPCVRGSSHVTNLYLREHDGSVRQLTVDQEHNWCPTVLNNGRVLYLRWEYTDTPHAFYRLLFHMNPDGTEQMEFYGSNSYWPNAMFYARPIPNQPTKVVAVVGGHHDRPRMGQLVVFDPAKGRFEADGAVQRIPGRDQEIEPIILDGLTQNRCPRFLHPYPLSEKYFLTACQPTSRAPWGIYLVDVFDNFLLLCEEPGYAMMEPLPIRAVPRPPAVPDRIDRSRKDATVLMTDVYQGGGLQGVPRGTIKSLRLISYHFSYQGMGGQLDRVGLDGPWDVKRIVGTVPVEPDGSAHFRVPAYTPIAVQPLDAEGKAVQLMRSWFTAMPGEVVSCVGCHDRQNTTLPVRRSTAATRPASTIEPWYGPARGFSFRREVQPVLDEYCVGCHNAAEQPDGRVIADLTDRPNISMQGKSANYNAGANFPPSYFELRKFVRAPTIESDAHLLPPREYHADTTKLVQLLEKGHYGVRLDAEAWDRLITWIDLHAPAHGTWTEICGPRRVEDQRQRRRAMRQLYTGMDDDPEAVANRQEQSITPVTPEPVAAAGAQVITCPNWPFDTAEAKRRQADAAEALGVEPMMSVELAKGVTLELVLVPAGEFVTGDVDGYADEDPPTRAKIDKPFYLGRFEITNQQYALFDPRHDSRLETGDFLQFSTRERGYPVNAPDQPVVRVSWQRAMDFCRWLTRKTGRPFTLPNETQWEYACRAGTATPFWYGDVDTDFSSSANVSDASNQAVDTFGWSLPSGAIPPWRPADVRFDDHHRVAAPVGSFAANPWGLFDMHGNVSEWTRSVYRPVAKGNVRLASAKRNDATVTSEKMVVRGGSWYDRPKRCRSASRLAYVADQVVFDVGFRVICEVDDDRLATLQE